MFHLLFHFLVPLPSNIPVDLQHIARTARGRVGVASVVWEGGPGGEVIGLKVDEQFPMQSVYKVPIAMAVLSRVDKGLTSLDTKADVNPEDIVPAPIHSPLRERFPHGGHITIQELIRYAIVESDGTASDALLKVLGGCGKAQEYVRSLGITGMVIDTTEKEMATSEDVQYRNFATPRSAVMLLRLLLSPKVLTPKSRSLLLGFMEKTQTGPHRIKGMLPPGTKVAHKTGSSRTVAGLARATNDIGIISLPSGQHLILAIFVSDSRAGEVERDRVIAKSAKALWNLRVPAKHRAADAMKGTIKRGSHR